jgi:hypothetical protein
MLQHPASALPAPSPHFTGKEYVKDEHPAGRTISGIMPVIKDQITALRRHNA